MTWLISFTSLDTLLHAKTTIFKFKANCSINFRSHGTVQTNFSMKVITLKIKQTAYGIRKNIAKCEPFLPLCKRFHFNHSYLSWIRDVSSKRNSPKHLNLFHLKHYVEYDSSPYLRLKLSKLVEISKKFV